MSAPPRSPLAGIALVGVGVVLLSAAMWLGSDPLAHHLQRLLTATALALSSLACLVTAFRWLRPPTPAAPELPVSERRPAPRVPTLGSPLPSPDRI